MQKEKTVEFWDELHARALPREWIVCPSEALLEQVVVELQKESSVLEIGCGTSCLSRDLYCYYKGSLTVVATDVSAICIRQNQQRHHALMDASQGRLSYQILNVLESNKSFENKSDVILDKGCLDTLLFRSGRQVREHLVHTLLNNVHKWLKDGGKYMVMTPRSRIQLLRDYKGFSSVKRVVLDESSSKVMLADLDGDTSKSKTECYIYVCLKDSSYTPGEGAAFRDSYGVSLEVDEQTCPRCGMSFLEFRSGEDFSARGSKQWARRWRGHRIHCKGPNT